MDETNKAIIITFTVLGLFSTIIMGLACWSQYEMAKLDYVCTQE